MRKKSIDDLHGAKLIDKERDIRICLADAKTPEAKEKFEKQLDYCLNNIKNDIQLTLDFTEEEFEKDILFI